MSQERVTYPPLVPHGPDDQGAIVVVVSYSLMFITLLFALLRAWSSFMQKRDLRWDDFAFFIAALLIVPETVLTGRAVNQGLGRHINNITASMLDNYYKYFYATQILGIIIQSFAKFSVVLMVERIASEASVLKTNLLKIAIGSWVLFSFFTIVFQCGVPRPWVFTNDKCAADGKLYYVVVAGTLVTDGVLACFCVPLIWKLQMKRSLKILVCFLFALRLVVCAVTIPYLVLLRPYLTSDDKTWYNANLQILHQVVINLSVMATGILGLRRFLSELQTGRLGLTVTDAEYEMSTGRSKVKSPNNSKINDSQTSGVLVGGQRGARGQNIQSPPQSSAMVFDNSQDLRLRPDKTARYTTHVIGGSSHGDVTERDARDRQGHLGTVTKSDDEISDDKSTSSLRKNGVYQVQDFEMHVEYDGHDDEIR